MVIINAKIFTMEGEDKIIGRGWLSFDNGVITGIGEGDYTGSDSGIVDAGGAGLYPGFIDGHSHIGQSFLRSVRGRSHLRRRRSRIGEPYRRTVCLHKNIRPPYRRHDRESAGIHENGHGRKSQTGISRKRTHSRNKNGHRRAYTRSPV